MATAKIWHYRGHVGDEGNSRTLLPSEPYISRQSVTTSGTAASSTPAPAGAHMAQIEVTVSTRFKVTLSGTVSNADANDPKLLVDDNNFIHLPPGAVVSLIEAA